MRSAKAGWTLARCSSVLLLGVCCIAPVFAQQPNGSATRSDAAKTDDHSKDQWVVERSTTNVTFRADGTYTMEQAVRMRTRTQNDVQQLGVLKFSYPSANADLEVVYMRVTKPDGRVVATPAESVIDMPGEVSRDAPFYSDIKEKHVAVRGLEPGDAVEYDLKWNFSRPLAPGQFWWSYGFTTNRICLDEQLQVSVPAAKYVKVQSTGPQPTISEQSGVKIYAWKTSNQTVKDNTKKKFEGFDVTDEKQDFPRVQVTTFQSWAEVGKWFADLAEPQAVPTPDVKAKADELTRNAKTDEEKTQILYNFVSSKIRYIGISLGIGRYQPHAASDVLANGYGDCKDKHTLLAAMLAAEGIEADPALMSQEAKVDPDIPSPAQFDHVITVLPHAKAYTWLDTTPGVNPYGFLLINLRNQEALVMLSGGAASLMKTPQDPPFPAFVDFHVDGTLDSSSTLKATMKVDVRGDAEVILRIMCSLMEPKKWEQAVQGISYLLEYGGQVSDVTNSDPHDTSGPFHLEYKYTRTDYPDWSEKTLRPPLPPPFIPEVPGDAESNPKPLKWPPLGTVRTTADIKMPPNAGSPMLPHNLSLNEPFGQYQSTYSFRDGILHVERRLAPNGAEIAADQLAAYAKFRKEIDLVESIAFGKSSMGDLSASNSGSTEARDLLRQGQEEWEARDIEGAAEDFQKAVKMDPDFALGWLALGEAHLALGDSAHAVEELRKAIQLNPEMPDPYNRLGAALLAEKKPDEALSIYKELEKNGPANEQAPQRIGGILLDLKRYDEAIAELEPAVERYPNSSSLLEELAFAYLKTGNTDKGVQAYQKAIAQDSSGETLNNVAYELAEGDMRLDDAAQFGQKAVERAEKKTTTIDADELHFEDLSLMTSLFADWDTLGWVYYKQGHLEDARRYLSASWELSQDGVVGDHYGQLLEKMGRKDEARKAYAGALSQRNAPSDTRKRLVALTGSESRAEQEIQFARTDLSSARMVKVGRLLDRETSAQFFIVFDSGTKSFTSHYISGDESLKEVLAKADTSKFSITLPDQQPVKILRRGILSCEPTISGCIFVVMPTEEVKSLN